MQSKMIELNVNEIEAVVGGLAIKVPTQKAPPAPTGMNGQNAPPSAPKSTHPVSVSVSALG